MSKKVTLITFIVTAIFMLTIVYNINSSMKEDASLGNRFAEEALKINASSAANTSLALSDTFKFEWDTVYIFPPYTPNEDINKVIGYKWLGENTYIGINDNINTLVFADKGRVKRYIYVKTKFDYSCYFKGIFRQEAVFIAGQNGIIQQ